MEALLQEAAEAYDYVFLDMPPVLAVTDAALMSSRVDGTIIILGSGDISPDEGKQAKELLEKVHANILGVILNKVPQGSAGRLPKRRAVLELSAKLTERFLQRPVSYISNWSMWHGFTTGGLRSATGKPTSPAFWPPPL